jgi:tetratricopeptide (TPR) repeat protein
MLVAKIWLMNVMRLCLLFLAVWYPLSAYAADISEEQITSPTLRKAMESLKANKPSDALKIVSEFKPDIATLDQYHFVSGRLRNSMKKPLEAVEHFRKAYLYAPKGDMKEISLIERAETYLGMRYFYEAKSVYFVFLKEFPQSRFLGRVYPGLARSLAEAGSHREAIAYYEKAGNSPDVLIGKANTLHRSGMYPEADNAYAAALETGEALIRTSDESLYYLGENLRLMGKFSEAAKYLSLVKSPPFKSRADLSLGIAAMQQEKSEDAVKSFSDVLSSDDNETKKRAILSMADLDLKQGKMEEAKKRLEDLKVRYPYGKTYDEALLRLARLYRKEGNAEKAAQVLSEVAFKPWLKKEVLAEFEDLLVDARSRDKEQFGRLWKTAGPLLLDASREKFLLEVAADFRNSDGPFLDIVQYLAKYGTEGGKMKSLAILAGYYAEKGDADRAGDYLKKLKAMKGSGEEILRLEARLAYVKKEYKTAAEKFLQVKKLQTGDLNALGDIIAAGQDLPKALARYEKTLKETGGDARAYIRIADIIYGMGRTKDALNYYRMALAKDPNHDWVLYRIGSLTQGPEAEEMLRKVSKQDPTLTKLTEARLKELDLEKKGVDTF